MEKLLSVEPLEVIFPFELGKILSSKLQLSNNTDNHVAFKFLVTDQKKYTVKQCMGIVMPRSTCDINIQMRAQKEAPLNLFCKDKFKIQSFVTEPNMLSKDITSKMQKHGCLLTAKSRMYVPSTPQYPSGTETKRINESKLLKVEPSALKFPFELNRQITCSLYLSNTSKSLVAFKVTTTDPEKYCIQPSSGMVLPQETCGITVTMQAQNEAPANMQCGDKFTIQSVVANPWGMSTDNIMKMFGKESGSNAEEHELPVVLLPQPLQLLQDCEVSVIGYPLAYAKGTADLSYSEISDTSQDDQLKTLQWRHQSKIQSIWRWIRRSIWSMRKVLA